jgi:hypothetical protein
VSSHREAPEISKDPVADSTDLYAFVSPDHPDKVTLIANYLPLQEPPGGPNFYPFGDDVLYEIHIDNDGDARADITYQFRFQTQLRDPNTFLYNTGPILSLDSPNWNSRQFYSVTRVDGTGRSTVLASGLACPPDNIGPLSTPNYPALAQAAVHTLGGGAKVFAGQRADGFYVDLGSIFDLLNLRPFQQLHQQFGLHVFHHPAPGVNALNNINVKSIALQVPKQDLVRGWSGKPHRDDQSAIIGVWTSASRQQVKVRDPNSDDVCTGPFLQVSRLGNPLVNEVIIPLGQKDRWNHEQPADDKQFSGFVLNPEVARLLPPLYPGVFPNLAALVASGKPRTDLLAILHTGIPAGVIPGFQNFTGTVEADMLRLNTAIAPTTHKPSIFGLLGGDLAGFPNGRRPTDDVVSIELRAIAGVTFALVDNTFVPDKAANALTDGLTPASVSSKFLDRFPYLGVPYDGYHTPSA